MHQNSTRPMLVWPGKQLPAGRTVPTLLTRELHGEASGPEGWRNLLIKGDNLKALSALCFGPLREKLEEQGGVKLIYCDPPFAVGNDFTIPVNPVSVTGPGGPRASSPRMLAYSDQWQDGLNGFLSMMYERLALMRDLLSRDGSLYLHCDWRTAPYLRIVLDELFGPERFLGDIVWHYTGGGRSKRRFSRKHDRILHYAASDAWYFNPDAIRVPYKPTSGYAKGGITSAAGKHYSPNPLGTVPDDVWDIPMVNPLAGERCGYPTQKPLALLERIILASSRPGDVVADFFCGSGTTPVCAERLGRRWIAVDNGSLAVHTVRKRLASPRTGADMACRQAAYALALTESGPPLTAGDLLTGQTSFSHQARLAEGTLYYRVHDIRIQGEFVESGLSVTLRGFALSMEAKKNLPLPEALFFPGRAGPEQDDEWRRWLDYWSVGLSSVPCDGMDRVSPCPVILWQCFREKDKPTPVASPVLILPESAAGKETLLAVTLVDVFANESRVLLPLREA